MSQKASTSQGAQCEQTDLFTMFYLHFGRAQGVQNILSSFPMPAQVALATFWPPGGPQEASEVPSCSPFVDFWSPPGSPRAPQESPKSDQKSPKVSSAAWVLPWGAPGMPNCFPRPFIRGHLGSFFASFSSFLEELGLTKQTILKNYLFSNLPINC